MEADSTAVMLHLFREKLFCCFGRAERVDSEVHQTSHGEDTDQEAGEFLSQCHLLQPAIFERLQKILLSDAPTPRGAPTPQRPTTHLLAGEPEMMIDLGPGPNAQML